MNGKDSISRLGALRKETESFLPGQSTSPSDYIDTHGNGGSSTIDGGENNSGKTIDESDLIWNDEDEDEFLDEQHELAAEVGHEKGVNGVGSWGPQGKGSGGYWMKQDWRGQVQDTTSWERLYNVTNR